MTRYEHIIGTASVLGFALLAALPMAISFATRF